LQEVVEIGWHGLRSINCYKHYNQKWATGRLSWCIWRMRV